MTSGLPSYPSQQQLMQEAQSLAGASVPTQQSINQQYGRSLQDVNGFAKAVISLLQGGPGVGAGYTDAATQQRAVDAAAQARLAALGLPYAGSRAVAGAQGDSALANLLSRQAAAQSYGAQLPHVAAARGALMQQGLIQQRQQALTQRAQDYWSALAQAYPQVQQNALSRSVAIANIGNQQAQLALQRASLAERQAEFQQTFGLEQQRFYAGLAAASPSSGTGGTLSSLVSNLARATGLTQNEVNTNLAKATSYISGAPPTPVKIPVYDPSGHVTGYRQGTVGGSAQPNYLQQGIPFAQALSDLTSHGVQLPIALAAAAMLYRTARGAPATSPKLQGYVPAYLAYRSFVMWMAEHGFRQYANQARLYGKRQKVATTPGGKPLPTG